MEQQISYNCGVTINPCNVHREIGFHLTICLHWMNPSIRTKCSKKWIFLKRITYISMIKHDMTEPNYCGCYILHVISPEEAMDKMIWRTVEPFKPMVAIGRCRSIKNSERQINCVAYIIILWVPFICRVVEKRCGNLQWFLK